MSSATFIDRGVDPPSPDYFDSEVCGWCEETLWDGRRHSICDRKTDDRTCANCRVVMVDYERGDACEFCGRPLGI